MLRLEVSKLTLCYLLKIFIKSVKLITKETSVSLVLIVVKDFCPFYMFAKIITVFDDILTVYIKSPKICWESFQAGCKSLKILSSKPFLKLFKNT